MSTEQLSGSSNASIWTLLSSRFESRLHIDCPVGRFPWCSSVSAHKFMELCVLPQLWPQIVGDGGGEPSICPYPRNGENRNLQTEKIYQTFLKKIIKLKNISLYHECPRVFSKLEAKRFRRNFVSTFSGCLRPP